MGQEPRHHSVWAPLAYLSSGCSQPVNWACGLIWRLDMAADLRGSKREKASKREAIVSLLSTSSQTWPLITSIHEKWVDEFITQLKGKALCKGVNTRRHRVSSGTIPGGKQSPCNHQPGQEIKRYHQHQYLHPAPSWSMSPIPSPKKYHIPGF